jgi:hypothetical protein
MKVDLKKIIIPLLLILIFIFFISLFKHKQVEKKQITHSICLSEGEIADFDYDVELYNSTGIKLPINSTTTIYIKNKETGREIYRFTINNVVTEAATLEIHKCGVYVVRGFDFDEKARFYKIEELWQYGYDGKGKSLIDGGRVKRDLYSLVGFRIDPSESFLALNRAYLGHPDYEIIVKNLKTSNLDDVLIIKPESLWEKLPQLNRERYIFDVVGWSRDGKYLWGGSESPTDRVYFRVNVITKELEVFVMPKDAIHYGPPRVDTGYIWYIYGPSWVGIHEIQEQIYEEWRKENKKKILYLYNLFTKEKIKLAEVDDPAWNFRPRWLSDNELRYQLPSGETKIYKIK